MIFPIVSVQFIESAYISGESKQSISKVALNGRALGPSTVDEIVGVPGGIFVKHKGQWTFCAWANVKSASLEHAPYEIVEYVAARDNQVAVAETRMKDAAAAEARAVVATGQAARVQRRRAAREAPASAQTVQAESYVVQTAQEGVRVDADDLLDGPPAPPRRDAMGVLIAEQPTRGPKITCGACGDTFVQGSNHVCQKVVG